MTYACTVCGQDLRPHGDAGMTCPVGHHFLAADIHARQAVRISVRGRAARLPAWLPGAAIATVGLVLDLLI